MDYQRMGTRQKTLQSYNGKSKKDLTIERYLKVAYILQHIILFVGYLKKDLELNGFLLSQPLGLIVLVVGVEYTTLETITHHLARSLVSYSSRE